MGFESRITEFRSDVDWAIRRWFQLAFRDTFLCNGSSSSFVHCQILFRLLSLSVAMFCFNWTFLEVTTWVKLNVLIRMVFTIEWFFEVATHLFIYLYFILCWQGIKNIVIYTTHYIEIAMQTVFSKEICRLIYVNQYNGKKINGLKTNLNTKNVIINTKHLRKTNRRPRKNPSTRKPG